MVQDKYSAVWVSHSSLGDFLKCPRAYYLNNVYKNPETGKKISIINPSLSLGQVVHETLESLIIDRVPSEKRFTPELLQKFDKNWERVRGEKGGFENDAQEENFKNRGRKMLEMVIEDPGPLLNKAVKLPQDSMPPNFFLSEDENIILCGLIDWLEYIPETESVRIIDFKTGLREEDKNSLQMPIYLLLASNLQNRPVSGASYWYLDPDKDEKIVDQKLPDIQTAKKDVLRVARMVKEARENRVFVCPKGESGCFACKPFEKIIKGEAKMVGINDIGQEVYIV